MTTPRPWTREKTISSHVMELEEPIIIGPRGDSQLGIEVAGCCPMTEENADLIVRAVNAHDALVAALEGCMPFVQPTSGRRFEAIAQATAALRAAKGAL